MYCDVIFALEIGEEIKDKSVLVLWLYGTRVVYADEENVYLLGEVGTDGAESVRGGGVAAEAFWASLGLFIFNFFKRISWLDFVKINLRF